MLEKQIFTTPWYYLREIANYFWEVQVPPYPGHSKTTPAMSLAAERDELVEAISRQAGQ